MKIAIIQIADRGTPGKERLHLKALTDLSLSYYAVVSTSYVRPGVVSGNADHVFWFTPKMVKAGDSIVLFTTTGTDTTTKNADGTTNHFYYWGKKQALWETAASCAVVFELGGWAATPQA